MIGPFIFLDLDGVLNGHKRHGNGYLWPRPGMRGGNEPDARQDRGEDRAGIGLEILCAAGEK